MQQPTPHIPKIKIQFSECVDIVEEQGLLSVTCNNFDNQPSWAVHFSSIHFQCRHNRTAFLEYGYEFSEDVEYLFFKRTPFKLNVLKCLVHSVEDALTGKLLWPAAAPHQLKGE